MKKYGFLFLFAFLLLALFSPAAHAEDSADALSYDPDYYYDGARVINNAGILSAQAVADLTGRIETIKQKYNTDVVVLTVPSLDTEELRHYHYRDIRSFAEDYYDYLGFGLGKDHDGLILVINMAIYGDENREYCIVTTGKEIDHFQKHMDYMYDRVYRNLSVQDYDGAADTFVSMIETKYKLGFFPPTFGKILISVGVGCLFGLIVTGSMKARMKTIRLATEARDYVVPGSFKLRSYNELYLRRTITQVPRQTEQRGGGGGGGFSVGSSGVSHGGGGGHGF